MTIFELFAKLGLDKSEYDKGLNEAKGDAEKSGSGIGKALGTAAKVGAAAMVAATSAAVAFGKSSVEAGLSFDATMSEVSAISGATGEDFDALRNLAMDMGASTKFSASEAAEGLTYMAMAGWKTEEMLNGLPGILNLAAASGESLGTTSDIVTDAMTAFGLSADQSGHFADVLAAASSNANTNVSMLGESFKYVAPVAGSLGFSIEDTSVALGLMANSGIKASQAGTALRTMLTNMSKPTGEMEAAMEKLGVSIADENGEMYSLMDIMQQLRSGFGQLKISEDEYRTSVDGLIEQLENGEISENDFNKATMELMERAYGAEGALKAEAAAMLAGKEGMSGLLAIVNTSDADFDKLTNSIYEADGAAEHMAAVMQDNLQGDLTIMQSALEGVQLAVSDKLTPSLREFAQFGSSALSSIGDAIREGGLEAGIEELGKQLGNGINMIVGYLPSIVSAAQKLLTAFVMAILNNAGQITQAAVDIVVTLATGLGDSLPTLVPAVVGAILTIVGTLLSPDNLRLILDAGLQLIVGLGQGLLQSLPSLIVKLPLIITGIVDFLISAIPMIIEAGIQLLTSLVAELPTIIQAIVVVLPQIISSIVDALIGNIPLIIQAGIDLLTALIGALPEIIQTLCDAMPEIVQRICVALTDNIPLIIEAGVDLLLALIENLPQIITELVKAVPQIVTALLDGFGSFLDSFGEIGEALINGLWEGIKRVWGNLTSWFSSAWDNVVGSVKSFLGIASPSKVFADIGKNMALGVGEGWNKSFGKVEDTIYGDMAFDSSMSMRYARPQLAYAGNAGYAGGGSGINEILRALSGMRVVMDTGETVGALATPMNGKLGDQFTYRKRGII